MNDLLGFAGMPMMSLALGNSLAEPSGRRGHGTNALASRQPGSGNDIFGMLNQVQQMMNGQMQEMMSLANNGMQLNMVSPWSYKSVICCIHVFTWISHS